MRSRLRHELRAPCFLLAMSLAFLPAGLFAAAQQDGEPAGERLIAQKLCTADQCGASRASGIRRPECAPMGTFGGPRQRNHQAPAAAIGVPLGGRTRMQTAL